jgi:hypothetical protein
MPNNMSLSTLNDVTASEVATSAELVHILKNLKPKHPALNRVCAKLVASEGIESAITSYDRMHHRHNRS